MFEQLLAIIRNTFFESIRQPVVLVVLLVATLLLVISNPLAAFTMEDDQRMLVDIGLATIFVAGAMLAALVATGVLTREIENKTALTVISKPVGRPLFVIGKFLGVAGALMLATLYLSFVFMLVEQHHVIETVRDPVHVPVIVFGTAAAIIGLVAAIWSNYFYGKVFASTLVCFLTPLAGLAYLFSMMFGPDFRLESIASNFEWNLWRGLVSLAVAILVLTAVAIAASARFGQVLTLCITLGVFMLGLLSDWLLGRPIRNLENTWLSRAKAEGLTEKVESFRSFVMSTGEIQTSPTAEVQTVLVEGANLSDMAQGSETLLYSLYWIGYSIIPNFQVLWKTDALTQQHVIPLSHLAMTAAYGFACIATALGLAVILFQRREVG